jgi:hypothetical protein
MTDNLEIEAGDRMLKVSKIDNSFNRRIESMYDEIENLKEKLKSLECGMESICRDIALEEQVE